MANNNSIFVPQTFNGARMVNVSKRTPTTSSSSTPSTTASSIASASATADAPPSLQHVAAPAKDAKSDIQTVSASPKSKVVPIKPYASSQSVIDTRAKPTNASRTSIPSSSKPSPPQQPQHQQQQAAAIPVQPRPPQPHQQVLMPSSFPSAYDVAGFERVWSEANVAVLIQLHRKHYTMVTSMNADKYNDGWTALSSEYNAITADNRSKSALITKWDKLMAKYNAERAFLIMPRPQGLQQPLPTVSYWNHFQYMDSYLSHVPLPENCILKRKHRENNDDNNNNNNNNDDDEGKATYKANPAPPTLSAKRPRTSDLNMELLEIQRVFMEKTLDKQNTQIEIMRTNVESMHKMNMKFVNICEKACSKGRLNEERYLNLLERCLLLDKKDAITTAPDVTDPATPAAVASDVAPEPQKPLESSSPAANSSALPTHSSASPETTKHEAV
ncbi:hypothetical protein BD408DRAFT_420838 [Parasitella parasitica]|nr:hypothetical protein BD408DRAFT_420838 [Parasitella parasitica]